MASKTSSASTQDDTIEISKNPNAFTLESASDTGDLKRSKQGFVLIPQPSSDPQDPLNWSTRRKWITFMVISFVAFASLASIVAHVEALVIQAKLWHVTPTKTSYSVTAVVAGLIAGPVVLVPLAQVIGVSSLTFWSLICMAATGIWSAEMTGRGDYIGFIIARLFAGFAACPSQIIGNGVIVNIFFLHERGKAFAIYTTFFTLGVAVGPTFSGFIVEHTSWPVSFWWIVGLEGALAVITLLILEDTTYQRGQNITYSGPHKESWISNRVQTFLPGYKVVKERPARTIVQSMFASIQIFFSPVTVLAGLLQFGDFGWSVLTNNLLAIFLQAHPPEGWGFNIQQTASFSFSIWFGMLAAQLYGVCFNDSIPLKIAAQRGGFWRQEYRLHSLWFPCLIVLPIGLGFCGAALEYHLHYMVLAVGYFLVNFGAVAAVSPTSNYIVECFEDAPQEVGVALNAWRLLLGLAIPLFFDDWEAAVGRGWVFGMAAFFSIFEFFLVMILMWKGHSLKPYSLLKRKETFEDGAKVVS